MADGPKLRKPCSPREAERLAGIWLTPADLAEMLQMNERTVTRYLEQGKLPGARIGTRWRTKREWLDNISRNDTKEN